MTNIPYPASDDLDDKTADLIAALPQLNLIKIMAHAPPNLESVVRLSDSVLNRGVLDPVLRQVAVIRLAAVVGSDYERTLLESVAVGVGMSDELIAAAREGSGGQGLTEAQSMAARLAEELALQPRPSQETFAYFKQRLTHRELVELVQVIGFYLMQTRLIETFAIDLEDPPVDLSRRLDTVDRQKLDAWRDGVDVSP